jgi:hypothetical protein
VKYQATSMMPLFTAGDNKDADIATPTNQGKISDRNTARLTQYI